MRLRAIVGATLCVVALVLLFLVTRRSQEIRRVVPQLPRTVSAAPDTDVIVARVSPDVPSVVRDAAVAVLVQPTLDRDAAAARTTVLVATWGDGPDQLGRRVGNESNPEAPMALSVAPDGEVIVVDQANRRLQRFRDGRRIASVALASAGVQDLAQLPQGRVAVLDRLADATVRVHDSSGAVTSTISVLGGPIAEGASATGVFADEHGVYIEREHGALIRIAGPDGQANEGRDTLWGRPSRDGTLTLRAAIFDRRAGDVDVSAHERASDAASFVRRVRFGGPILHVMMLDSDARGSIYVAVDVGRESELAPYAITDEHGEVVRLAHDGAITGSLRIAPAHGAVETFRSVTVGDDGAIYQLIVRDDGVEVVQWRIP